MFLAITGDDYLPQYKAKVIIRLLKEKGYVEKSIHGDHHEWVNSRGQMVIVPYKSRNTTLAVGTFKAIIKQIDQSI